MGKDRNHLAPAGDVLRCGTNNQGCCRYKSVAPASRLRSAETALRLFLGKPVAGVGIVIDPVFLLQFLDVAQIAFRMRSHPIVGVKNHLLQTTAQAHVFALREIFQQASETLLQPHRQIDALNLDRLSNTVKMMAK